MVQRMADCLMTSEDLPRESLKLTMSLNVPRFSAVFKSVFLAINHAECSRAFGTSFFASSSRGCSALQMLLQISQG